MRPPWAIPASSALAGVLLVLVVYAAAATLLQPTKRPTPQPFPRPDNEADSGSGWWPFLAALLSAILYPTLSLSRWGTGSVWGAVLATLAVACFWHGLNAAATPALPPRGRNRSSAFSRWPWLTLSPWHSATPAPDVEAQL
ncbi:MAG: hypothetical protein IPL78_26305 [Chloroflexi bacterium]|nr:hypothetical protein [Chloroflexota bacterium]